MNQLTKTRGTGAEPISEQLLERRIQCGDVALTLALGKANRCVLKREIQVLLETFLLSSQIRNCTHMDTVRLVGSPQDDKAPGIRPKFSQNGK